MLKLLQEDVEVHDIAGRNKLNLFGTIWCVLML